MKKVMIGWMVVVCLWSSAGPCAAATTEGRKGLMPIGAEAPDFSLGDVVTGRTVSKQELADKKAMLVIFLCRHCPYVQRVKSGLAQLGRDYLDKDVAIVAISANDADKYKEDSPEGLKAMAEEEQFPFPLLYDPTQTVAKAYTAVATPDFFLFDGSRKLVYRGQFDDARPGNEIPVTGRDVRAAIDAVLADAPVPAGSKPPVGCSIKWKPGQEPDYMK